MKKALRLAIAIAAVLVAVAAAVTTIVYFKDEILDLLESIREKIKKKALVNDEYNDYADV